MFRTSCSGCGISGAGLIVESQMTKPKPLNRKQNGWSRFRIGLAELGRPCMCSRFGFCTVPEILL